MHLCSIHGISLAPLGLSQNLMSLIKLESRLPFHIAGCEQRWKASAAPHSVIGESPAGIQRGGSVMSGSGQRLVLPVHTAVPAAGVKQTRPHTWHWFLQFTPRCAAIYGTFAMNSHICGCDLRISPHDLTLAHSSATLLLTGMCPSVASFSSTCNYAAQCSVVAHLRCELNPHRGATANLLG